MESKNVGPYILGAGIAVAVGMFSLGNAIRDAGDRVGTDAGNAGSIVADGMRNATAGAGRFHIEKAGPQIADNRGEAFWVFDSSRRYVQLYTFVRVEDQVKMKKLFEAEY